MSKERLCKVIFGTEERTARFHCFSTNYEELRDGVGQYPVAIVEYVNGVDKGTIAIEYASDIKFIVE